MKTVFADTYFYIALLNCRDANPSRVLDWANRYKGKIVTSEWVLVELANGISAHHLRKLFVKVRNGIIDNPKNRLIPFDPAIYAEAIELYDARPDKQWSLTDCTSFAIMNRDRLTEALTADHHFAQAGFVALLSV